MPAKKSEKKLIRSLEANGFYSDCEKSGYLHAALIRSPAKTGKVKNVTIEDLPEGYFFFTAENIPGEKNITYNNTSSKIFGYDNISYEGEPLGILVGPDEQTVYSLLDSVNISFDVESLESALHNVMNNNKETTENFTELVDKLNDMPSLDTVIDKSNIQSEENENPIVCKREVKYGLYESSTEEEADKILFENNFLKTTDTWIQNFTTPKWQETEGAFCYTEGENIHVYVPTKWTYFTQITIAHTLKIKPEQVFIHKTRTASIYPNGLWRTAQIATQVAIASYLSKKPVKLIFSQHEQDSFLKPGVEAKITYKSAIDEAGIITALNVHIDIDIGSSNPFAQEITDRITLGACNYYKPKNLYIYTTTHTSKNPPTTISPRVIDSQAFFAIENQIQKISYKTNIFPDELRLINSINAQSEKKKTFPYEIPTGNIEEAIQTTIKKSDFNRKYASFHMEAMHRLDDSNTVFFAIPLRGIGISTGYIGSDFAGTSAFSFNQKIEVTLTTDDKVIIHSIKPSEVIQDIWKSTVSEILQIPKQNIIINSDFELNEIPETPEESISAIGIMTETIKKCCNEIQKKRFHQPLPLTSKKSISPSFSKKWNKDNFSGIPFYTTSFISTVVEVELDTYTYSEKIKGIWVTIDCGELFDEQAAIRSIKMEIQQELTALVKGKTVPCDAVYVNFIKSNNKSGQIGGLIHNSLPSAFSSALSLALTTQLTELPCTESQLFELIKNRTKQHSSKDENIETSEGAAE